jgi:ribonuclease R
MEDRVGEEFAATVSSLADFGFFVELDAEHVEGLVRADDLGPGHRLVIGALVWPNGRRVQVGQALTVRLAGVNVQRRQMDFDVVAFAGERPSRRRGGAERAEAVDSVRGGARRGGRQEGRDQRRGAPAPVREERSQGGRRDRGGRPPEPRAQKQGRQRHDATRDRKPQDAPEASEPAASPHPGFDRLRALAAQEGRGGKQPARRQGSKESFPAPRGGGRQDRGRDGSQPRGGRPGRGSRRRR